MYKIYIFVSYFILNITISVAYATCPGVDNIYRALQIAEKERLFSFGATSSLFPKKYSTLPFGQRLKAFLGEFPQNTQIVPDITFRAYSEEKGIRKVLVISTEGLSKAERKRLIKRYIFHLSYRTLSTIDRGRGSGSDHLFIRYGRSVLSFAFEMAKAKPFRLPNRSSRIEPLLLFSEKQAKFLEEYVYRAYFDTAVTLGRFSRKGVRDPKQLRGKVDDNRPIDGLSSWWYHNCCSWATHAPLDSKGTPLHSIIGVKSDDDRMYVEPKYWNFGVYLRANKHNLPVVVLWTKENLFTVAERIQIEQKSPLWFRKY